MNKLMKYLSIMFWCGFSVCNILFSFKLADFYVSMENGDSYAFYLNVLIVIGIVVIQNIIQHIAVKLRMKFTRNKLIEINKLYFNDDISSGEEEDMSSYSTKTDMISNNYLLPQVMIPVNVIQLTITILAYIQLSWYYLVYMLAVVGSMMIIPVVTKNKSQKLTQEYTDSSKNYLSFLSNTFIGKRELGQYNSIKIFKSKHDNVVNELFNKYEKHNMYLKQISIFSNLIGFISFVGVFALGGILVLDGKMEMALFMTGIQLMNYFTGPIFSLIEDISKYQSMKKIIPSFNDEIQLNNKECIVNDKIELNNLSYSYDGINTINYPNINFNKNNKYLINGKSGTGKSTLAKILSGAITNYNGDILFDGNIDNKNIIYVPQSPHLFFDSVIENITLGRNISDNDLKRVIELTNIEEELLSKIIDVNSEISGGQKARVSLARSLVDFPSVMVVDEPTANLDYKNSLDIIQKLCSVKELTLIVISHENSSEFIECFDEVIKL